MNDNGIKNRSETELGRNTLGVWVVVGSLSALLVATGIIGYLG